MIRKKEGVICFLAVVFLSALPPSALACETVNIGITAILDSSAPVVEGTSANTVQAQIDAAHLHSSVSIYDSLGDLHTLYVAFYRVSDDEDPWLLRFFVDAGETGFGLTAGEPYYLTTIALSAGTDGAFSLDQFRELITTEIQWSNGAKLNKLTFQTSLAEVSGNSSIAVTQDGSPGACTQRGHLDFDADGVDDLVVWRPSLGMWAILLSASNHTQFLWKQWGLPGDHPMAGDYGHDGKTDLVIWRPSNGTWYICASESGYDCSTGMARQFGLSGDRPISGDFDGDGTADFAVWRPSLGMFFYLSSRNGTVVSQQWGLPDDIPVLNGPNS